jgi:hypothetical protein
LKEWLKSFLEGEMPMSQIVVAQSFHGIILAAENRAIRLNEKGEEVSFSVNRLVPLSPHSVLIAAGAAEGIDMGIALKNFIQGEGVKDIQDLYSAALAFLATEYERFMRKKCELLPIDAIHHVSFILAGKTEKDREKPFRLYYLWTKKKLPQLDGDEISNAFSLPRRMGLEFQLNRLSKENASLDAILARIKDGIERLKAQKEVGSSFSWAKISPAGYEPLNL